jgi:hypothetical protein
MGRAFEILAVVAACVSLTYGMRARADSASPEICQPRDDKADSAAVDSYFVANLREHDSIPFVRPIKETVRGQAKTFLEQRIGDRRAELCAAHLKLAEDVKTAAGAYTTADCGAAAVVALFDQYLGKVSATNTQNLQQLGALLNAHVNALKLKLFDIAKGSTAGIDGIQFQGQLLTGAPQEVKFEWIKQEASRLGAEAHVVWGATNPGANPLLLRNGVFAREAARAKLERDGAKVRFHSDGKLSASCKLKQ